MNPELFIVKVVRWSGKAVEYAAESYRITNAALVIDRPDGCCTLEPWAQVVRVDIEPDEREGR